MRMRVAWGGCFLGLLLLLGACGKSSQLDNLPPVPIEGVNVDMPQLSTEFVKAPPEVQAKVNEVVTKVRYKRYIPAMMDLESILNGPGLNDKQKKLLTQVNGQLKEVVAKNPGNP